MTRFQEQEIQDYEWDLIVYKGEVGSEQEEYEMAAAFIASHNELRSMNQ